MELRPSTYYLDRINASRQENEQRRAAESEASRKSAEAAAKAATDEARRLQEERAKRIKEIYGQDIGASMWGSHRGAVSQMAQQMNANLDKYVSDPVSFQQALGQMNAFIDSSKAYYSTTSRSMRDAIERSTVGAVNPYERDGLKDSKVKGDYEGQMEALDSVVPNITLGEDGMWRIGDKPMDQYVSSFTVDPFQPKLEQLPALTAGEIYAKEKGGMRDLQATERIIDEYIQNPVKLNRIMQGVEGWDPANTSDKTSVELISRRRTELLQELQGLGAPKL
jgi:hypothetical protein